LSAPPTRQAVLSVGAPDPVQRQHDLCGAVIDIGDCFVDEGSHNPLLQPASVVGADQTAWKSLASTSKETGGKTAEGAAASCSAIRVS
jgi:hypothetical protein